MNKQLKALSVGVVLAVAASATDPMPAQAQADPIQVMKNYFDTLNTGDFGKTLTFFADDAVVKNPLGVFVGKDQIAKWLEQDVKTTRSSPKTWEMQGPFVVSTGVVALDRFTKAGVPYVNYRAEYIVGLDGKIRFMAPVPMPTPEQAAKLQSLPASKPKVDPIKVAQGYVRAVNNGNFNVAHGFYAPDAAALVVGGTRLLSGKAQIGEWLKDDVKTTRATPVGWQLIGNTVINTGTVSLERFDRLDIGPIDYRSEYVIADGKIRFFRPMVILTREQQAKVGAATAAVAPFAGMWAGQMSFSDDKNRKEDIEVSVPDACIAGGVCGQINNLSNGCVWQLTLTGAQATTMSYTLSKSLKNDCPTGSSGTLERKPDGTLFRKHTTPDFVAEGALVKK